MRSIDKMTTTEALASANGWTLVYWDAAYAAACNSVSDEMLADVEQDADDLREQITSSVNDAVTGAWIEGLSHDEWVSAALRRLR